MSSARHSAPVACIVCGQASARAVLNQVGIGVSAGAPGESDLGELAHYACSRCGAKFAREDERLVVGGRVHVLHLSIRLPLPPFRMSLVSGPFWDDTQRLRLNPLDPIAAPTDARQMNGDELREWARRSARREGQE